MRHAYCHLHIYMPGDVESPERCKLESRNKGLSMLYGFDDSAERQMRPASQKADVAKFLKFLELYLQVEPNLPRQQYNLILFSNQHSNKGRKDADMESELMTSFFLTDAK